MSPPLPRPRKPGVKPRPGSVSLALPAPDGARVDTEHVGQGFHAESLPLAEVADQPTQIGGLWALPGVVPEELDYCRQGPETGGGGSGLPIEDGGHVGLLGTQPREHAAHSKAK